MIVQRISATAFPLIDAVLSQIARAEPDLASKYYRARYYDPKVGRFISEDPIGFWGGINFYEYGYDDPANFVDPTGLDGTVTFWPKDAHGYGHTGVGVNTSDTEGFYSTNKPLCLVSGCEDPGRILNDQKDHPGETPLQVTIQTTPEQDAAMQRFIDARRRAPGNYNLKGRNCSRFVSDTLRIAGVEGVPDTAYPEDLFNALKEIERMQKAAQKKAPKTTHKK